jgi:hypothetical protein
VRVRRERYGDLSFLIRAALRSFVDGRERGGGLQGRETPCRAAQGRAVPIEGNVELQFRAVFPGRNARSAPYDGGSQGIGMSIRDRETRRGETWWALGVEALEFSRSVRSASLIGKAKMWENAGKAR